MTIPARTSSDLAVFLEKYNLVAARQETITPDASARQYIRLYRNDDSTVVLMDAHRAAETVQPFLTTRHYFDEFGLSVPEVYVADPDAGLFVIEDFGHERAAEVIYTRPGQAEEIYDTALDVILTLHRQTDASLRHVFAVKSWDYWQPRLALFLDHYLPQHIGGKIEPGRRKEYFALWHELFTSITPKTPVLCHGDFHLENIFWLPQRDGVKRCGLIDFQDCEFTHPAFDIGFLLQDVRREVPVELEQEIIDRYLSHTPLDDLDRKAFLRAYAVLNTAQMLKCLGLFTRLSLVEKREQYSTFLPRTHDLLGRNLAHNALAPLAKFLDTLGYKGT